MSLNWEYENLNYMRDDDDDNNICNYDELCEIL